MRPNTKPSLVASIIRDTGIVVADQPSVNYPIAVNLFYLNNADGSVRCIWAKGNRRPGFLTSRRRQSVKAKLEANLHRLLLNLGLTGVLPYDRLILYADVPTATYLQKQWSSN
jgi:hypothetical protein